MKALAELGQANQVSLRNSYEFYNLFLSRTISISLEGRVLSQQTLPNTSKALSIVRLGYNFSSPSIRTRIDHYIMTSVSL